MQIIKSLAILALAVAAMVGFNACQAKGTVSSTGATATTTTSTK